MTLKKIILKTIFRAECDGSYTVEAALIMAITLFLIAALLTEAFHIHGEVVGDMILMDTMEQWAYPEEHVSEQEISQKAEKRLKTYFRCQQKQLEISESRSRINGNVRDEKDRSISVRVFEPERYLRLLRAVGI